MELIAGIGSIALCLVLVGSAVIARRRVGEPVARYALVWAAIVAVGFVVAIIADRHAS